MALKKTICLFMIFLLLPLISALDECGDSVPTSSACSIITPVLTCGSPTHNILYSNGTSFASSKTLSQIGSSGIYNASFTATTADTYIVKLSCDDASRSIIAVSLSLTAPTTSWWSYLLMIYYNTLPGAW